MVLRRKHWLGRAAGLLLIIVGAAGCGGEGTGGRESLAAAATPASTAPVETAIPAEADEATVARLHARALADALNLDAATEDRVRAAIEARWTRIQEELNARRDALLPIDEEQVTDLIAAQQRALDAEIADLIGPARRAAFAEYGGRMDDPAPATTPTPSSQEAR